MISNLEKKYKFKDLKIFSSTETMDGNTKKYRRVYDTKEITYLYCELSFYNKLFDEADWEAKILLKAFALNETGRRELCCIERKVEITSDQNIVIIREGWGNKEEGTFWLRGDYEWEAYIEDEFVGIKSFYVENGGVVDQNLNPYFEVDIVRLYEGPNEGIVPEQRKSYIEFDANECRFIWVEFNIINKQALPWYCELFFNFYNDAGQLKGNTSELKYINPEDSFITFTTGWGADSKGTWYHDKYTLEVIFMDQLIAVIPFEVKDDFVEGIPLVDLNFSNIPLPLILQEEKGPSLEELMKSLHEMIGLSGIKSKITDYTSYLKFLQLRKDQGFEENQKISLHSVFLGNPGTGKTTIAKLLGQIYFKLGLLSKGKVTEAGRAELCGKYIGQTAPQTKEVIEKARGGVLFIDEAYSLVREGDTGQDFGREVIEVLLKEMSDGPGDLAIIVAGYPKEMNHFLVSNPGLKSRFNLLFEFPDYLPQELIQIAELSAEKRYVKFSENGKKFLSEKLTEAYRNRNKAFGNARMVTGLVEEAKMNMGLRVMKSQNPEKLTAEQLQTIELEDVKQLFKNSALVSPDIPVDEVLLQEALSELNKLTGLEEVKNELLEMVKLVRFYIETGRDVLNKFSLHTVFTGNPGTGKTSVARIIAKIYKALGILERGHLVETDRQGLVAGYIGQTAIKTMEQIEKAHGGVLFIDEAYALSEGGNSDFGKEAIETLLKQMEDKRGQFIVVVAGYVDNMRIFMEANPGLKSRFDKVLEFNDYEPSELFSIALNMLAEENLTPDEDASARLKEYLNSIFLKRDKFFGNARSVRKIIKEAIRNQHLRMASLSGNQRTVEVLQMLTMDDVKCFIPETYQPAGRIGFRLGS
ncbi:MAG: AAA family ATPase [Sporocytophaga sp.]|uniref:AAA family ATPase n=1 Tax=Sporocytophaga sp. TaxID=2231183 RepID=UPI001B1BA099|nr:AAA family ATPase [Sporocytophaga sp.]MBO9700488.1 AAA family ATPase [Sporocytophaga sp.]